MRMIGQRQLIGARTANCVRNIIVGICWTLAIVGAAAFGVLGAGGALIAAVLHNLSTLLVLANAGRLLRVSGVFAEAACGRCSAEFCMGSTL